MSSTLKNFVYFSYQGHMSIIWSNKTAHQSLSGSDIIFIHLSPSHFKSVRRATKREKEVYNLVNCTWMRVKKRVLDLRCGASRSLRDKRSCPPSPGQHPSGVCWSQWLAGLPSCWDGHLAATCMWSVHHLAQICMLFPLEKIRKERAIRRC